MYEISLIHEICDSSGPSSYFYDNEKTGAPVLEFQVTHCRIVTILRRHQVKLT